MAGNSILAKMAVQITAQNAEFSRAMQKSQKDLSSFVGGITKMAGALGVAFGVQQVASFALEVSKLAGEAQAVRAAFERLPESTKLMQDLKEATGGTVSELDLMKRAVQASNFDISLQALPKLLEFATLRAQQTGQSVDYLVDSIVTGIGRKSKLILDNLGISAVQLNKALGDTAIGAASIGQVADAVGRIIDDNLKNMEGFSENASTNLQRLSADWTNLKVAIGDAANSTGVLGQMTTELSDIMTIFASKHLSFWESYSALMVSILSGGTIDSIGGAIEKHITRQTEKATEEAKKQAQVIKEVDRAFVEFGGNIEAYGRAIETHIYRSELLAEFTKRITKSEDERVQTVGELRDIEKELLATREGLSETDTKALKTNAAQIQQIRERIKAIDDLLIKEKEVAAFQLSQTAQRALSGQSVTGTTGLSGIGVIPGVDNKAILAKHEEFRNINKVTTEEVSQNWFDLSGMIAGSAISIAEGIGGAISGVENFGVAVLSAFADFARQFGQMLIASGIAALALKKLIVNPVAAIAAGVGLVAIAGAASGALSKAHSGLTGGGSSAPGRLPSEVGIKVGGRIRGYDLAIVNEKESYRRGRLG